jgi:hypothetical protein
MAVMVHDLALEDILTRHDLIRRLAYHLLFQNFDSLE